MSDGLRPTWSGAPGGRREWATLYQRAPPGRNRKAHNRATFQLPATTAARSSMLVDGGALAGFARFWNHLVDIRAGALGKRPLQRHVQHLLDPLDRNDLKLVGDVLEDFRQVLAVVLGNDDGADATAQGR